MFHTSTQREHWLFDSPSVLEAHRVSVYKRAVADIKKVYEQAGGGGPADEDFLTYEVCVCVCLMLTLLVCSIIANATSHAFFLPFSVCACVRFVASW